MSRNFVIRVLVVCALPGLFAIAQDDSQWQAATAAGIVAADRNDFGKAEQYLNYALRLAEGFGPKDFRVSTTLNDLGLVYHAEHKYSEAEASYRKAEPIMLAAYGMNSIDVANINYNLASVMFDEGHEVEALTTINRALGIYQRTLGDSSPKTATMLCMKGDVLRVMKHYLDAEGLLRRCADVREKNSGLASSDLANALLSLARTLYAEGKNSAAETRYQLVEKIREKNDGITSPGLAESLEEHATVLRSLGRENDAEKLMTMAEAIRKNLPKAK